MPRLILAHDLGTSGDKATLFSEEGELVASSTASYPTHYGPGGVAEQNPADWWRAVGESTRAVMAKRSPGEVAAIAFSGQMSGCLCVDRQGTVLRPHMLYCDQRSVAQEKAFVEQGGADAIYRLTGHRATLANSAAKLMWVRDQQPEIYRQTHCFLNAKDYLNFRLTGRLVSEPSDASGTNLFDLATGRWSEALTAAAGLDGEKLPELIPSTGVVGELTSEAAKAMGLVAGIPVVAGAGDGVCAGVGAGSISEGRAYSYIGSSAWVGSTSQSPLLDPEKRTFTFAHAVPGLFHLCGAMQTGAASYAWLKREICQEEEAAARDKGESPYARMDQLAASSPPGAHGLLFLPYLLGERSPRWNSHARAAFIGLTMAHQRSDLARAVLEGVAFNLAIIFDVFREAGAVQGDLLVIGGGARSDLWQQILADVFQVRVARPNFLEEATSIGAAVIAGVGAGIYPDFQVVDRFFRLVDHCDPVAERRAVYQDSRRLFDRLYQALEPVFPDFTGALA